MKLISISVLALAGFLYGAYVEQVNFERSGDPSKFTPERTKHIQQAIASTLRDRAECIARDPGDWCDRDLNGKQLAAFHGELYDKYNFTEGNDGPRQARNRYLLYALIATTVLIMAIRAKKTNSVDRSE